MFKNAFTVKTTKNPLNLADKFQERENTRNRLVGGINVETCVNKVGGVNVFSEANREFLTRLKFGMSLPFGNEVNCLEEDTQWLFGELVVQFEENSTTDELREEGMAKFAGELQLDDFSIAYLTRKLSSNTASYDDLLKTFVIADTEILVALNNVVVPNAIRRILKKFGDKERFTTETYLSIFREVCEEVRRTITSPSNPILELFKKRKMVGALTVRSRNSTKEYIKNDPLLNVLKSNILSSSAQQPYIFDAPFTEFRTCPRPCERSPKMGSSWWKRLGYNSDCGCAKLAHNQSLANLVKAKEPEPEPVPEPSKKKETKPSKETLTRSANKARDAKKKEQEEYLRKVAEAERRRAEEERKRRAKKTAKKATV